MWIVFYLFYFVYVLAQAVAVALVAWFLLRPIPWAWVGYAVAGGLVVPMFWYVKRPEVMTLLIAYLAAPVLRFALYSSVREVAWERVAVVVVLLANGALALSPMTPKRAEPTIVARPAVDPRDRLDLLAEELSPEARAARDERWRAATAAGDAEVLKRLARERVSLRPALRDLRAAIAEDRRELVDRMLEVEPGLLAARTSGPRPAFSSRVTQLNIPGSGETALFAAVRHDRPELLDRLLELGADPRRATARQTTLLMATAYFGRYDMARELLATGGSELVHERDIDERTALMFAVRTNDLSDPKVDIAGRARVVELLLARGADVDHVDRIGGSVLDLAIRPPYWSTQPEVVRALLDAGATRDERRYPKRVLRRHPEGLSADHQTRIWAKIQALLDP